jgi:hypothetical protein
MVSRLPKENLLGQKNGKIRRTLKGLYDENEIGYWWYGWLEHNQELNL